MRESLLWGAAIGALVLGLFVLERFFPLRRATRPLTGRLLVNLAQWETIPASVRPILAFLLMDLTFYWWHRANHRIPLLWRFHNIHHIDPDLDVSTAFRFHFGELAFSSAFRLVQIGLIGPSLFLYLIYETIFQAGTFFHHSNLRLPIRAERLLVVLIVTPRMHGIHHSHVAQETNSNYATVFSFWDRLHRTLGLNIRQSQIDIGIPGYSDKEDNSLKNVLVTPFKHQRDYWRGAHGEVPVRTGANQEKSRLAM
jgi:sterol desaturase/sphingolipid hydroxylase (fatty acid hydroxylase superfamily)